VLGFDFKATPEGFERRSRLAGLQMDTPEVEVHLRVARAHPDSALAGVESFLDLAVRFRPAQTVVG
jgi:hypothetical protein